MKQIFRNKRGTAALGPVIMFAAAFNFAVLDILVKLLGPSFRVWDIAFYRFACSLLILTLIFAWRGNPFKGLNPKLMALNGLVSSLGFVALATSIRLINISTAMALFYSFPAFAALFSTLLFREHIRKAEFLCVVAAMGGVMVLIEFRLGGNLFGQIMGLAAGITIGFSISLVRKLREHEGAVALYLYYCLIGTVVVSPMFFSAPQVPGTSEEYLILAGIILSSIFAMLLMNTGLRYCKSWEGGLILTNELVFTALFGIFMLHDPLSWRFLAGGFLILGSVVAFNFIGTRTPAQAPPTGAQR